MATPTISEYTAHLRQDKANMRNYLNAANVETKESDTFTELAEACLRYTGAQLCVYCQPEEPLNKWGLWFKTPYKIEGLPLAVETESINALEYAGSMNVTFNSTNRDTVQTLVEVDNGDILSMGYMLTVPEGGNGTNGIYIFRYFKDTGTIQRWFNLIKPDTYTYTAADGSFFYHKESGLLYYACGSTAAYWASRTSGYYVIDPSSASNTWKHIGSTASGKFKNAPCIGYYDNKLFVFGGTGYYRNVEGSGSGGMNTYDVIDLATNTVSNHTLTGVPYLAGYAQVGQYIYCIGGCKDPSYSSNLEQRKNYTTISRFNMATRLMEWNICDVGANYTYGKYNNKGIVIGTKIYWFVNKDKQHVYDFATNTFSIENLINYPEALEPSSSTFTMPALVEDGTKIIFGYGCLNLYPGKPYVNVNRKEQDVDCVTITNVKFGESNMSTQLYYDYLIKGVLKQYFTDAWLYTKDAGYDTIYPAYYGNGEEWVLMREGDTKIPNLYLIEDGQENTSVTAGYTFTEPVAQVANANMVAQEEDSFIMNSGLWARGAVTFNREIALDCYEKLYIDFEFPTTDLISSMKQYMDVTVRLLNKSGEAVVTKQIVAGSTVNRTTVEIPLNSITDACKLYITTSNLTGTNRDGNSPYTAGYPIRFYGIWFVGKDKE
jgi:hypothetical protein